jgi:hypothetical protein
VKYCSALYSSIFLLLASPTFAQESNPENILGETGLSLTVTVDGKAEKLDYVVKSDGDALFEGDIILGQASSFSKDPAKLESVDDLQLNGLFRRGNALWPKAIVRYIIDTNLPNKSRVTEAISHWKNRTDIDFSEISTTGGAYIKFVRDPSGGCSSSIGMLSGGQSVKLGDACTAGNTIHEIGHALGLGHEQCRSDRNSFVTVLTENIKPAALGNFNVNPTKYKDVDSYDYGSIMHYGKDAFAKAPSLITIVTKGGQSIGQRAALSAEDVSTIQKMYASEVAKRLK